MIKTNGLTFPPSLVEISRIAKENGSRSILIENKLTNETKYSRMDQVKFGEDSL